MYTCTRTHALNALALRFRKGQKGVTDKHTYIRVRSHTQTHTEIRTHKLPQSRNVLLHERTNNFNRTTGKRTTCSKTYTNTHAHTRARTHTHTPSTQ